MADTTNPGRGVGLRNVGSYQISGHPFITGNLDMGTAGSEYKVEFPYVAKSVTVIASGAFGSSATENSIKVHFNSNDPDNDAGSTNVLAYGHYITLDSEEDSMTFDVKCKEIYITNVTANAQWQIFASLTGIPTGSMYALTGSGLTDADI
tara:strand:+ start:341 stop:790 length:450 start_codon:yes stop_codon:yes gene_type:complete